ncbi:MAG: spore maturation protein [Ruminococcaceae bacterium]|nr:spore maturation protein [Oscillospiraceae bacterium]
MRVLEIISSLLIPLTFLFALIVGVIKKVDIYSAFVNGAKDSLKTALNIFPAIVTLMIAIGIFRTSGLLDFTTGLFSPILNFINVPKEILPIAILRPMSGSGGLAMLTDIIKNYGPDSKIGVMASVICGSTETTFYTVAVYFGSVGITNVRHTVKCALLADLVSIIMGILVCNLLVF